MCYSALFEQDYKKYMRYYGVHTDYASFERFYIERLRDRGIKGAKAMDASFAEPTSAAEQRIKDLIDQYRAQQATEWEEKLFAQRARLVNAERKLATKETKTHRNEQRIASNKVAWHLEKLADLKNPDLKPKDSRIFPFWYAPVVVMEQGKMVLRPMRYHCRPAGKPAWYDTKYDGLYNARRDNLEGFWKDLFGKTHAFAVASSFYENVALHNFEHRPLQEGEKPQNVVLHFNPQPPIEMRLACLWSRWSEPGKGELLSFAAITDEPPPEVAAAGHDRCVIPLRKENLSSWLNTDGKWPMDLYAALDDRERPYYEHQLAA